MLLNRRGLVAVAVLSAALHLAGMVRTPLPAQDGLKFLRVARQFQSQPWVDVVRGSDQHPLYPALVALAEPVVAVPFGHGPTAWRVAAQGVSLVAAVLLLVPLWSLTRHLFGERAAGLAVLLYALLPVPAGVGHDTLADSLCLMLVVSALALGERTLRIGSWRSAMGCGLLIGLGFLTRPEALLVAPAIALAGLARWPVGAASLRTAGRLLGIAAISGAIVGGYAATKGALSEKLSLRIGTRIGVDAYRSKKAPLRLPPGLDDPRWDFSPKEETGDDALKADPITALGRLGRDWAEGLGWVLVPIFTLGHVRGRYADEAATGRRLLGWYSLLFAVVVVRHASTLGYLSGRHALSLVVVAVPWAAAGLTRWAEGFPARRGIEPARAARLGRIGLAALVLVATVVQLKGGHPSRWGHQEAGRWLAREARADQAVLDTRGWAWFLRGGPGYDPWHIRQALGDSHLGFVVVGADELRAPSPRAATLRAILDHAATPAASFPAHEGGRGADVLVYRFEPPASWEGLRR